MIGLFTSLYLIFRAVFTKHNRLFLEMCQYKIFGVFDIIKMKCKRRNINGSNK